MSALNLLCTLLIVQLVKGLIIQTSNGPIQGTSVRSGRVEAFLGIPYAQPPIGNLRFKKPIPKAIWKGVYDASRLPPPCIQPDFDNAYFAPDRTNMSEDCLYLNVWIPTSKSRDKFKTIMLFIHGGGFLLGSSSMELYDGATLSEHGDVVVVTINYRLGGLGFFTAFNKETPGSIALYDQVMAIQWIKENARNFHGDPDRIVLFGESAGAFSISMHQVSPLSKRLFKRAILQSGSAVNPLYFRGNDELSKRCHMYAEVLGCASENVTLKDSPKDIVDCLRQVPAEMFAKVDRTFEGLYTRIGNDFLPGNTMEAFRQGHFTDLEVLMGINSNEGTLLITADMPDIFGLYGTKDLSDVFNETTAYLAIKGLIINSDPSTDDNIINGYLSQVEEKTGYGYLKAVSEAVGDSVVTCGAIFQAEYQSMRGNPVYFYEFSYRRSSSPLAEWMGVAHFDELQFVLGNPMHQNFTKYEKKLSRHIMNIWASFAKTGSPSIPCGTKWPKYTYRDPKYLVIGKRDSIGLRPDHYRCERWRPVFSSVIEDAVIQTLRKDASP